MNIIIVIIIIVIIIVIIIMIIIIIIIIIIIFNIIIITIIITIIINIIIIIIFLLIFLIFRVLSLSPREHSALSRMGSYSLGQHSPIGLCYLPTDHLPEEELTLTLNDVTSVEHAERLALRKRASRSSSSLESMDKMSMPSSESLEIQSLESSPPPLESSSPTEKCLQMMNDYISKSNSKGVVAHSVNIILKAKNEKFILKRYYHCVQDPGCKSKGIVSLQKSELEHPKEVLPESPMSLEQMRELLRGHPSIRL